MKGGCGKVSPLNQYITPTADNFQDTLQTSIQLICSCRNGVCRADGKSTLFRSASGFSNRFFRPTAFQFICLGQNKSLLIFCQTRVACHRKHGRLILLQILLSDNGLFYTRIGRRNQCDTRFCGLVVSAKDVVAVVTERIHFDTAQFITAFITPGMSLYLQSGEVLIQLSS